MLKETMWSLPPGHKVFMWINKKQENSSLNQKAIAKAFTAVNSTVPYMLNILYAGLS